MIFSNDSDHQETTSILEVRADQTLRGDKLTIARLTQ
jgi:hypothetical protein